jgi:hypothetical protein
MTCEERADLASIHGPIGSSMASAGGDRRKAAGSAGLAQEERAVGVEIVVRASQQAPGGQNRASCVSAGIPLSRFLSKPSGAGLEKFGSEKTSEKQIVQVLAALRAGCDTSKEIAEFTGMSVGHVSTYLFDLVDCGAVTRRKGYTRRYAKSGPPCFVYEAPE